MLQPQVEQDHRAAPRLGLGLGSGLGLGIGLGFNPNPNPNPNQAPHRQTELREGRRVVALAAVPHTAVALDVAAQPEGGGAERLVHIDQGHHHQRL